MAFTKVAIIGAGGNLGKLFVQSLLASTQPKFEITVLARSTSSYTAPTEEVKVIKHSLTDHDATVESLRGKDALILMQGKGPEFESLSKAVIESAIVAGVKMVMPSDYGGKDTPLFVNSSPFKLAVGNYVREKAKEGAITYTLVKNGVLWDMPLKMAHGIDYQAKKATIFGEGTQKFHATSNATVANAVVSILRSPSQYANKTVYIHDLYTNQQEILSIVESEVNPDGSKFETTSVDVEELGKRSLEGLKNGEYNMQNIFGILTASVWGSEGAADWDENDDSQALGLEKKDLRAEIKQKMEIGN